MLSLKQRAEGGRRPWGQALGSECIEAVSEPEPRPDVSGGRQRLGGHVLEGPGCQAESLGGATGATGFCWG